MRKITPRGRPVAAAIRRGPLRRRHPRWPWGRPWKALRRAARLPVGTRSSPGAGQAALLKSAMTSSPPLPRLLSLARSLARLRLKQYPLEVFTALLSQASPVLPSAVSLS